MVFVCYVCMYLKLGKWDRVNAVKMVKLAVQVRRNRFPCGTNRFPLIKTERCEFWVAGNRFPDRDNLVPHSKNLKRVFGKQPGTGSHIGTNRVLLCIF